MKNVEMLEDWYSVEVQHIVRKCKDRLEVHCGTFLQTCMQIEITCETLAEMEVDTEEESDNLFTAIDAAKHSLAVIRMNQLTGANAMEYGEVTDEVYEALLEYQLNTIAPVFSAIMSVYFYYMDRKNGLIAALH